MESTPRVLVFQYFPWMGCCSIAESITPSIKFAGAHVYTWVERGTVRVISVLPKSTTLCPRSGLDLTRTAARSRDERTNHETTAPPNQFCTSRILTLWIWIKNNIAHSRSAPVRWRWKMYCMSQSYFLRTAVPSLDQLHIVFFLFSHWFCWFSCSFLRSSYIAPAGDHIDDHIFQLNYFWNWDTSS